MKRHIRVSEYNKTLKKKNLDDKGGICQLQPYSFIKGGLWKKSAGIKKRRNCEMLQNWRWPVPSPLPTYLPVMIDISVWKNRNNHCSRMRLEWSNAWPIESWPIPRRITTLNPLSRYSGISQAKQLQEEFKFLFFRTVKEYIRPARMEAASKDGSCQEIDKYHWFKHLSDCLHHRIYEP